MSSRKCIYTGKNADCLDKVVPHDGGDIDHNWANSVPCSKPYKKKKGLRLPTEIEIEINRAFRMLELAKIDVDIWSKRLQKLQEELQKTKLIPAVEPTQEEKKQKQEEIKIAYKEKELQEVDLNGIIEKKKKQNKVIW